MRTRSWTAAAIGVFTAVAVFVVPYPNSLLVAFAMVAIGLLRSWLAGLLAILVILATLAGLFPVTVVIFIVYVGLLLAGDPLPVRHQPCPVAAPVTKAGPATNSLEGERS